MESHFRKESSKLDRGNFNIQKMKLLGEISKFCIELRIDFLDLEFFCCLQKNRSTRIDRSKSKEDMKMKEGIDLLMKRDPKGMEIFVCWPCKEFGHFPSKCPKRVRKTRKSLLSDKDEEFKASMERFLNDCDVKDNEIELVKKEEVLEEIALVTIVDPKANHENVEVIIETNNNL